MVKYEFPCDIDDTVYVVVEGLSIPAVRLVRYIYIEKNYLGEVVAKFFVVNVRTGQETIYSMSDFGKTVFTDRDEAMRAVKERSV